MDTIIKFPSGFYGLCVKGHIFNAALVQWNGSAKNTDINYFDICGTDNRFEYYQDSEGTVYYTDENGQNARVWCPAESLRKHLCDLKRILKR